MIWIVEFVMVDKKGKNISLNCLDVISYKDFISCTFDTHSMSYPKHIIKSYSIC